MSSGRFCVLGHYVQGEDEPHYDLTGAAEDAKPARANCMTTSRAVLAATPPDYGVSSFHRLLE